MSRRVRMAPSSAHPSLGWVRIGSWQAPDERPVSAFDSRTDILNPALNRLINYVPQAIRPKSSSPVFAGGSTVGQQLAAVAFEPGAWRRRVRRQTAHQLPEARPVVHLGEMRHLVRHDVVDHRFGRKNETPAE